jgi:transposase InsO family protein
VIRALSAAVRNGRLVKGLVLYSDRGSEYACATYQREIARIGARQSLSRSGSCLDAALAEAFFATLKAEIGRLSWST